MLIFLPVIAFVVGAMTWLSYRSAISDFRRSAQSELAISNNTNAAALGRKLQLIATTERKAVEIMNARLDRGPGTRFAAIADRAEDGAWHTPDTFWSGEEMPGGVRLEGVAGFFPPPTPSGRREDSILAAFETIRAMSNGLSDEIESLYFFSPANDLLIYAPDRADRLEFYRNAPADFGFQDSEFNQITLPANNPDARLRCTSLQNPAYDETGRAWTTGCMYPMRREGRHLGAWGVSIPLPEMVEGLRPPPDGAFTIIVSAEGRLIHHSAIAGIAKERLAANIDLASSDDPLLSGLWQFVRSDPADGAVRWEPIEAQIVIEKLDAPDWYVLTAMPDAALSERAWNIASRVILIGSLGALALALIIGALFHSVVARRIIALARRADQVSARVESAAVVAGGSGDEIERLESSFARMEGRIAQAEERERRSFDMLVDAADGYAMVLFDAQGELIRANRGAQELLGAAGIAGIQRALAARLAGEEDADHDLPDETVSVARRELPDGTVLSLSEALIPLVDDAQEVFGYAFVAHDLTEITANERKLEESMLFLELAQASAKVGHFALDPVTMEVTISSWIRERFGIEEARLPLVRVAEHFSEETREETVEQIYQLILAQDDFSFEAEGVDAAGKTVPVMIQGTAAFGPEGTDGQPIGFFGILRDIGEEREAEQALVRARDEAQAEARARSDLLAVVAHEIRTPISGMLGLIDQIRREESAEERQRALRMIEESSEALLQTLDATLQKRRLEREEAERAEALFRPADLAARVAGLFRPLARRKGLAIEVDVSSDAQVRARQGPIQQVLANLVSNALKFTAVGKVTITMTEPEAKSEPWTIAVSDTGPGIPEDRLGRIFEPFAGSAPDTLGRRSGSGLGLSITHNLVMEMGGTLTAENRAEGGTRMVLTLPLEPVVEEEEHAERGTIAIALAQESLALRAEIAAIAQGFSPIQDDAEPDILLTDDPAEVADFDGTLAVLVVDEQTVPPEPKGGKIVTASPTNVVDNLPDILRENLDE
ncbi:PAS domain-containing sensor histidine kinase [Alteriqipengyuania sp. 357]